MFEDQNKILKNMHHSNPSENRDNEMAPPL